VAVLGLTVWISQNLDKVGVDTDFSKSALLKNPPPKRTTPVTLKIVTFNIQALWLVGQNRPERMRAIPEFLAPLDPDLVGFQEAFVKADRDLLAEGLKKKTRLTYFQYYPSAVVGCGVYIASAYPIREAWFHQYKNSAPARRIWEGDALAGKGIGLARIELPGGGYVDFYNTHAQAGYRNQHYDDVRKGQMAEAALFIYNSRAKTAPAFVVGDFNCGPGGEDHNALVKGADLERVMTVQSAIDHIYAAHSANYKFEVMRSEEIPEKVTRNGQPFELSDHSGYFSEVRITPVP
jgi:sphingomyelin phosphodiesterase 2